MYHFKQIQPGRAVPALLCRSSLNVPIIVLTYRNWGLPLSVPTLFNDTRILNNVTRLQYSYSLFFSIKEEGELALPEEISYAIIYVA